VSKIQDGTTYHNDTPLNVIRVLEKSRTSKRGMRLKLFYGEQETGAAWGDVERCYIGRSTGRIKIPLVIYRSNSMGGSGVLDHCIVRIESSTGGVVHWSHDKFHIPNEVQLNVLG